MKNIPFADSTAAFDHFAFNKAVYEFRHVPVISNLDCRTLLVTATPVFSIAISKSP